MSAGLQQVIADNKMVLLVQGSCPYCSMAIQGLDGAGIEYVTHELSNAERSAMTELTAGKRSVPQGFVMGQHIGDCNDGPEGWMGVMPNLGPGPPSRLSALRVSYSKSVLYGDFVWARRALNGPKRRFPARAESGAIAKAIEEGKPIH